MTTELENIISKAYKQFGHYKIIPPLEVCTECCMTLEEVETLCKTPLRQISNELLGKYNDSASIANSTPGNYKYFLPRILELTALHKFPTHSPEIVFQRMTLGKHDIWKISEWTKDEIDLLNEYALTFFNDYLLHYPSGSMDAVDSFIVMFGLTGIDIAFLLNAWTNNDNKNSILHYADLVVWHLDNTKESMNNGFKTKAISDKLISWCFNPLTRKFFSKRIESLIFEGSILDESSLNNLYWTYDFIRK
jgi:hypothetical protein